MNKIFFYEANIWDCIYRGLKDIGIKRSEIPITEQEEEEKQSKSTDKMITMPKIEEEQKMSHIPSESDFFDPEVDNP